VTNGNAAEVVRVLALEWVFILVHRHRLAVEDQNRN